MTQQDEGAGALLGDVHLNAVGLDGPMHHLGHCLSCPGLDREDASFSTGFHCLRRVASCHRRWKETPSCNSIVAGLSRVATAGGHMSEAYDVVNVGGGIAGSALATVLARKGIAVAVLERDLAPADKVRGEYIAPWGVAELKHLGLLDALQTAGGLFATRSIPYDENMPGDAALPFTFDLSTMHPQAPGSFCMSHPAMCATLAAAAEAAGATYLRGVEEIGVSAGSPPTIAFSHGGVRTQWRPRLVIGADGRHSRVRHQLGFAVLADPPHNLLGGLLVEGVSDWPQDTQVIGTEDQLHFLIFPQGGDRVRLYLCYDFANKAP